MNLHNGKPNRLKLPANLIKASANYAYGTCSRLREREEEEEQRKVGMGMPGCGSSSSSIFNKPVAKAKLPAGVVVVLTEVVAPDCLPQSGKYKTTTVTVAAASTTNTTDEVNSTLCGRCLWQVTPSLLPLTIIGISGYSSRHCNVLTRRQDN
ncbi:hypothetical protein ACLKA7_009573 [Drosophila subpalustris]